MHSLQQSMENERNNPPVGSIPGSYLHNTLQYYPPSSQAHLDRYGRPLYPESMNKLGIPNEYKRPSSAPLTPVEPKKIGRRFRRSSSVEEPNPDTVAFHDQEMRRNNGRYEHPSDTGVRTSEGKLTYSEANRIVSSSHYSAFDSTIKPPYDFRQDYNTKIKNERNDLDNKISYRPYIDSESQPPRPYETLKKNLTESFLKAEEENRSGTAYHSGSSIRPSDNYFTYGQYAPPPPSQQDYYNKMNLPPHSRPFYPSHSEALLSRHKEAVQMSDALKRQQQHKPDTEASVQAMNTYFEMMANVNQATGKDKFARSRDIMIQKSGIHAPASHSLADSHLPPHHPRDFPQRHPAESGSVPYPRDFHEKSMKNPPSSIRYPHDVREKGGDHQPSVIRGGLDPSAAAASHHGLPPRPPWAGAGDLPPHEKDPKRAFFQHPSSNPFERHLPGEGPKSRNEQFKPSEAEVERFMRNNAGQYDVPNPYENPAYCRPEPVHPPELLSFHDKHHSDFMNTPPRALKEMGTPPLLKNEVLRADVTSSPSNVKKTPRPGPIVIPPTINNKAIFSTPMGRTTATLALPHSIYTPPPMLSPKSIFFNPPLSNPPLAYHRVFTPSSTGYVCQTPRRVSLIEKPQDTPGPPGSAAAPGTLVREESVEPEPKINVGPQFQATLPNVSDKSEAHKDVHRAGLMWSPLKEDKQKTNEVSDYLEMACSLALYGGGTNKEYALHILQRTRGNVKEAIRLLLSRRHILRADDPNADYHYSGSTRWNCKERLAFRTAFRSKGKVFADIQKEIGTKSVNLCVEFYYLWKAKHPESFRVRTRTVEAESEQDEDEVPPTPTAAVAPLSTLREPVFECDYPDCLARFISRQALNGHIRVHGGSHSKTPNDRRQAKEKAAHLASPKAGNEGGSMNSPPKRKKPPGGPAPTVGADGAPLQFQCKVCARVFSKVKSRSAHMKTHVKKDENNKTIKPSKNKIGPNEIVTKPPAQHPPQHPQQQKLQPSSNKPFDMLMHAAQQNAPPPASYAPQSSLSNTSHHSTQPVYNQPMDTNSGYNPLHNPGIDSTKLYNPMDNPKAVMFNPPPDVSSPLFNPLPLDKNRIPFTTSIAASAASEKNPTNPASTSMFEKLVDDKNAMPYNSATAAVTSKPAFDNNNNSSSSNSVSSMNTSS